MFVLGTAHLSDKSARDVRRLIKAVQPENVVVELCRSRAGFMYAEEGKQNGEFSARCVEKFFYSRQLSITVQHTCPERPAQLGRYAF